MYNTGTPISSKSLRRERWAREGKEIALYVAGGLGAVVMIIGMGMWVLAVMM